MANTRPKDSFGWRKTVFALLLGVFVGSQVNESIKVIQVYHSATSSLDAASDLPVDFVNTVRDVNDAQSEISQINDQETDSSIVDEDGNTNKFDEEPLAEEVAMVSSESQATNDQLAGSEITASKVSAGEPVEPGTEAEPLEAKSRVIDPESVTQSAKGEVDDTLQSPSNPESDAETSEIAPDESSWVAPSNETAQKYVEEEVQELDPIISSSVSGTEVLSRANSSNLTVVSLTPEQLELLRNPPPTNRTMNACLFIMDDTIRLVEWLAYHYTVLPLGHLIVAIDPKSKRIPQINKILEMWRDHITIDAFYNDTFLTLDPYDGWGRSVWGKNERPRGWFKNKEGYSFRSQAHKRRQNFFTSFCFGELYEKKKRGWTLLTDTDEYVTFNYRYPETEDVTRYDSITDFKTKEEVDSERESNLPIRDILPKLTEQVTIAQHLAAYEKVQEMGNQRAPKCLRVPGLTFSSHETNASSIQQDVPPGVDGSGLMTLRQRQHAAKDGSFSKAMLNLRTATGKDWFGFGSVLNVHTPNRRMCGRTSKKGFSGSGADYISSLFRIHHYKAGTIESYLERAGDWRGGGLWRFYFDRNMEPVGENSDLAPWFKWFIDKVGMDSVNKLLMEPLNSTYEEISNLRHIKEAKNNIAKLVPSLVGATFELKEPTYYNRTNHTIGACMYILDDTVRLMEWLAYHYTVLPLSHLILGLDPKSQREKQIAKIMKTWSPFVKIERYANDTWMSQLGEHDGWKRKVHPTGENETILNWYLDKNSSEFRSQAHKRRQNSFIAKCLVDMREAGHEYVFVADSDEFLIFNYPAKDENPKLYDTVEERVRTKEEIDNSRMKYKPIRDRLPPLQEHVTIADVIHGEGKEDCFRLPALNFSAHQDGMNRLELPPSATLLMTLLQHRTGRKEGIFSKALLDVTSVDADLITLSRVDSVHNPSRRICGFNGRSGSGADYMSSIFRINHYVAGSVEQYAERRADFRGANINRFINERHFEPVGENNDIDYWVDWFIQKVGMTDAEDLLFKPLLRTNKELAHIREVKAAKTDMQDKRILPPKVKVGVELNDEGEADEEE